MKNSFSKWAYSGRPWIWLNAAAIAISILMVVGLISLLGVRGLNHFWPKAVMEMNYSTVSESGEVNSKKLLGELVEMESVPASQVAATGIPLASRQGNVGRQLIKQGNRDLGESDFVWLLSGAVSDVRFPAEAVTLERREWGNFYGSLQALIENGEVVRQTEDSDKGLWLSFNERLDRVLGIQQEIREIESGEIQDINYRTNRLRLQELKLLRNDGLSPELVEQYDTERLALELEYETQRQRLLELGEEASRDVGVFSTANNQRVEIPLSSIVRAYRANQLGLFGKLQVFFAKVGEFISAEPREANTEGGVFPAIFGTVMMVMLMSVFVTPFGVIAAVYLREYAKQGLMTQIVRVAVNNLAGVPSIVYGVFGLGFFIYIIGGEIDQLFYPEVLPAPTFGTPGLLWASLTLALLTLPVVIVATEEGLARIPRSVREGSLALGATKFETLWRVVLPMASPAMMTGLILAVARAAGEVAPLMLVGVVKLAPSLPVDGNYPYLHLDQKFMHLGFHIYDVGFQSPNIEAARPLVFATAFLLVAVIALLNLSAVALRNHLREQYKSLGA